jgi:hypothetical protein
MFKLVAVIFAVINGIPSEQPLTVLAYNHQTFETLEACMGFAKTEEGAELRQTVNEMVMSQRGPSLQNSAVRSLRTTRSDA